MYLNASGIYRQISQREIITCSSPVNLMLTDISFFDCLLNDPVTKPHHSSARHYICHEQCSCAEHKPDYFPNQHNYCQINDTSELPQTRNRPDIKQTLRYSTK